MLRLALVHAFFLTFISLSLGSSFDELSLRAFFQKQHQNAVNRDADDADRLGLTIKLASAGNSPKSEVLPIAKLRRLRLHSNANLPQKIVMVATSYTLDEIHSFLDILSQINGDAQSRANDRIKLHLMVSSEDILGELSFPRKDFEEIAEVNHLALCNDLWTQDFGEVATFYPKNGAPKLGLIDVKKSGDLAFFTGGLAAMWSWDRIVPPGLKEDDQGNYGGNIEATPDDILVIGSTASKEIRNTFKALGYSSNIATVDTSWLEVGHVDELVSFIPKPDNELGYVAIVASPLLGLELLRSIPEEQMLEKLTQFVQTAFAFYPLYPQGFDSEDTEKLENLIVTLGQLFAHLRGKPTDAVEKISELVKFNLRAARFIDAAISDLSERIRAIRGSKANLEIISVPALFEKSEGDLAMALTPSLVNHVVLNKHIILPHPFLEIFEQCTAARLWPLGYEPHFVPSLTYHFLEGQLHCGSNVIRHPTKYVHPRYSLQRKMKL